MNGRDIRFAEMGYGLGQSVEHDHQIEGRAADGLEHVDGRVLLAQRLGKAARPELPFAFEHDGVLLHGRFDMFERTGARALVVDYKTNVLGDRDPAEVVEDEYRLQRLVYALACFRSGADEVEVVYSFLEQPDAPVTTLFGRDDVAELECELSAAITRIDAGEFVPTPSEFACMDCPALNVVCAGPRLRGGGEARAREAVIGAS